MTNTLHRFLLLVVPVLALQAHGGETPETILIRSALNKQLFGMRINDVDLVLNATAETFVVYEGNSTADPRGWFVLHENRKSHAEAVEQDLQQHRYDLQRIIPSIHVRGGKALVTTVDSGFVIDQHSGASQPLKSVSLWTFAKSEETERWLATAQLRNLGTQAAGPRRSTSDDASIAKVLVDERDGWQEGNPRTIASFFGHECVGYEGSGSLAPSGWKIILSNAAELEKWLAKRLATTSYEVNRDLLYSSVSEGGIEAIALSRDTITVSHEKGPRKHQRKHFVFWTLSRRQGDWKITNMLYDIGLPN